MSIINLILLSSHNSKLIHDEFIEDFDPAQGEDGDIWALETLVTL